MQIEMPGDVASILSCSCTGCVFIRRTWKDPVPNIVQSLDACLESVGDLTDPEEINRAGQSIFPDTDLRALTESILSCPCAACIEFRRVMSAPDQGRAELQAMMADLKETPDAPAKIGEFLRSHGKEPT